MTAREPSLLPDTLWQAGSLMTSCLCVGAISVRTLGRQRELRVSGAACGRSQPAAGPQQDCSVA